MTSSNRWNGILITALLLSSMVCGHAQAGFTLPQGGQSVLPENALLTVPVGGLSNTNSTDAVTAVDGPGFSQELQVNIGSNSPDTNTTQLTMKISTPVHKGDCLLASFYLRGESAGNKPAQIAFLFERCVDPWTKSVMESVVSDRDPSVWKHIVVPFVAAEDYKPGDAMCSLRLAFGPQKVELGGLSAVDYAHSANLPQLMLIAARDNPIGNVQVEIDRSDRRQTLLGLGGDFCQPRYGETTAIDPVGEYVLSHLNVAQARVGIPLNYWAPKPGVYTDTAQAHAAFLLLQMLQQHKIPLIGTVWEGPLWMLPGQTEKSGRVLDPSEYNACIDAIAQFLITARDKYGVTVDYFSFNEPNYGVNFLFTPRTMDAFIRQAGPRFQALGLKTKFLVGDTTGGVPIVDYARPLLQDPQIAEFLGPISFHCWDVLGARDADYESIALLGRTFHKPILCTEGGFDSALWQQPDAWGSWENGLKTALAYSKTLRLSGSSVIDYWTYENNYPLVSADGAKPFPIYYVMKQMQDALPADAQVVGAHCANGDVGILATVGPTHGHFSVLLVDPIGAGKVTLTSLPANTKVNIIQRNEDFQTDASQSQGKTDASGRLEVDVAVRSVVTVSD